MIRYQERSPSRRAWLILLGICVVAWLGLFLVDTSSPWMPTSIVGMLGVIAAITMWSTGRYGNITLTDTELRVGRARVPIADINPWGVSKPGEALAGKIIGGAYAQAMGTHVVGLTMRDGQTKLVQAKDPEALRAALEEALVPFRADAP